MLRKMTDRLAENLIDWVAYKIPLSFPEPQIVPLLALGTRSRERSFSWPVLLFFGKKGNVTKHCLISYREGLGMSLKIAVIGVISGLTYKRGERVN